MEERTERRVRRKARRWLSLGKKPGEVLKRVGRSRPWLAKWRTRFGNAGATGLRGQARRPHRHPRAWASAMRRLIVQTRHRLQTAPAGLIGARAIRHELRHLMPRRPLPSATAIYRVLRQPGGVAAPLVDDAVYFPAPSEEVCGRASSASASRWPGATLPESSLRSNRSHGEPA
jgi:hypothetical protein